MFDEKRRLVEQVKKDLPITDEEIVATFPKPKDTFQHYV